MSESKNNHSCHKRDACGSWVIIGSSIENKGTTDVHLYKGTTTTGNPIIISPNQKHGIPKGFSTITVSNPSTSTTAVITTMRN